MPSRIQIWPSDLRALKLFAIKVENDMHSLSYLFYIAFAYAELKVIFPPTLRAEK